MTGALHSPRPLPSPSSVTPTNDDGLPQQVFLNHDFLDNRNSVALYRRNGAITSIRDPDWVEREEGDRFSVSEALVTIFRKSLVGCRGKSRVEEQQMDIDWPTNIRHVAHVTYDRFNGFLGLPVEFQPEVPRRPPSASTRVFGVSTECMQLSLDSRGNCVPTILLMMQRRLYSQGGLQHEGIFRINPENGREEYVREQLNNGVIPDNIDVHCLAGLIKAWFRELPSGILDSLSPEHVMQAQSEDDCTQLVRLLPPTEAALLDWAVNIMADVARLERLNKMNARNVAMVFAPNMTQMSDPRTALMYAVQVMNFLKTLIVKTLRERKDADVEPGQLEPSDEVEHNILEPPNLEANESSEDEEITAEREPRLDHSISSTQAEPITGIQAHGFLISLENILPNGMGERADIGGENASVGSGRTQSRTWRMKSGQSSDSNSVKKGASKNTTQPVVHVGETDDNGEEIRNISRGHCHSLFSS